MVMCMLPLIKQAQAVGIVVTTVEHTYVGLRKSEIESLLGQFARNSNTSRA